jgi:hypothetical protein
MLERKQQKFVADLRIGETDTAWIAGLLCGDDATHVDPRKRRIGKIE